MFGGSAATLVILALATVVIDGGPDEPEKIVDSCAPITKVQEVASEMPELEKGDSRHAKIEALCERPSGAF